MTLALGSNPTTAPRTIPFGDPLTLTPAQIAAYAYQAGFRGAAQVKAVAIAMAESGGHPGSLNPRAPDYSVGLWQVNYYGGLLSSRSARYGPPSSLTDPSANARAAFDISGQGTNFGAWSTYTNGAYLAHMAAATAAVNGNSGDNGASLLSISGVGGALVGAASSVSSAFGNGLDIIGAGGLKDAFGNGVSTIAGAGSSLMGGVSSEVAKIAMTGVLLAGGVALVVLGLYRAASPSMKAAAPLAAMGA